MKFVHLHVHTHYSLLDGLSKLDELISCAKEDSAPAVAISDHGVMYGVVEFYQKCKKAGIKPIIGVEAYLAPGSRFDKNSKSDEKNYHLLLLAKNETGYRNIIKLVSIAHLEGFYYKPRVDWETLEKHHEGLIACTACMGGEIPKLILSGKLDKARERILEYNNLFGQDNFYLEIQPHPNLEGQDEINRNLIALSRELNVPLVATNDIHYLSKDDYDAQDVLLCLQTKHKKDDRDRMEMHGQDFYYKSAREMSEYFKEVPEAISNTVKIAESCNLDIELGTTQLPYFNLPDNLNQDDYLKELCQLGLEKRYGKKYNEVDAVIKERIDYELGVVAKMGFASYFLIVADFVNWAKSQKIVVGPGRGSAAGSLICFLTGITNLDPLKYDLLFERFLNPDRISMPDIDMDFADIRRDEVIKYVEEKYGKDHVSQIITFGTMAARAAIRDVGRVLNYPYDYCDKLAKMIPMFSKIGQAIDSVAEVKDIYKTEEAAKKILDYAKRLEGVSRHASTHACGILITKSPLTDYVPLQYASSSDRTVVSQYSLHPVEDLGLLKMDFLGLKNLTIIESAIKIIKNTRGLEIDIDKIPLDDELTYKLFQEGETTGVFQFESSGMKKYLRELKSTEFEDIIAMVALYRPGPMEWIPDYIGGKQGKKKLKYLHPKLEPILKKTYGVAIYQEQVMQMARDLAGFTMAEADVLRKAVGKKIAKLLAEQKEKFIEGCVKHSISSQLAETIFSFIEPFAGYGFNRSHAACYAMIGYQTAYLKAHWPTEFMAALLTADQQDIERISVLIEECRHMGIDVSRPDINQSFGSFTVVTSGTEKNQSAETNETSKTIRFGLKAIKNVGEHIAEVIIEERKNKGIYKDITDILDRITDKDMNKKSLESLIKSGALDQIGERGLLLGNIDNLLNYSKEMGKSRLSSQTSLFADAPLVGYSAKINLRTSKEATKQEKLAWEKELLGVYITEHPFIDYKKELSTVKIIPTVDLCQYASEEQLNVAGIITSIKKIITRSNESMLFVKIEDSVGSTELLVFPSILKQTIDIWQEGRGVLVAGKVSQKDSDNKILVNTAVPLQLGTISESINKFKNMLDTKANSRNFHFFKKENNNSKMQETKKIPPSIISSRLHLIITERFDGESLDNLKRIFLDFQGTSPVIFKLPTDKNKNSFRMLETDFKVKINSELTKKILEVCGDSVLLSEK
jgi:DNA polymerase III subunit alpha